MSILLILLPSPFAISLDQLFCWLPLAFSRGGGKINWPDPEREHIPRTLGGGALSKEDFMGDYSTNKIIILNKVNIITQDL